MAGEFPLTPALSLREREKSGAPPGIKSTKS